MAALELNPGYSHLEALAAANPGVGLQAPSPEAVRVEGAAAPTNGAGGEVSPVPAREAVPWATG